MNTEWSLVNRPGFFGRSREVKVGQFNDTYGRGNWRLVWVVPTRSLLFKDACVQFYERSYYEYLKENKDLLDFICSFGEVIDNAESNISSGYDYEKQESYSTHIQDIAIRNVLWRMGLKFRGSKNHHLVVRGHLSNGQHLNPGHVPFYDHGLITWPSLAPYWALANSVEDFWQSNKWLEVNTENPQLNLELKD